MKSRNRLLRAALIVIGLLLALDVLQHPSGSGNPACYPDLACHHHARVSHARVHR